MPSPIPHGTFIFALAFLFRRANQEWPALGWESGMQIITAQQVDLGKLLMRLLLSFRKQIWLLHTSISFILQAPHFWEWKWQGECYTVANLLISILSILLDPVDLGRCGKRYLGSKVLARAFSLSCNCTRFTCSNFWHNCMALSWAPLSIAAGWTQQALNLHVGMNAHRGHTKSETPSWHYGETKGQMNMSRLRSLCCHCPYGGFLRHTHRRR